jgi:hypothetical protein
MNSDTYLYLFLTAISIYISKKFGSVRNLGFVWSVIFSIFCPLLSFIIIFFSNKKSSEKQIPDITKYGLIMFAVLILINLGNYPSGLYKMLGSISLPFYIFSGRISGETLGEMSAENFLTIFPFYGLLRKYTSKYWS